MTRVQNCDVYYCEGGEILPIQEGDAVQKQTDASTPYGILFMAAPKPGCALSAMVAGNSSGKYSTVSPEYLTDEALTQEYGNLIESGSFTLDQLRDVLTLAYEEYNCNGAFFFSRPAGASGAISSSLQFYADRLPTLEKSIQSVRLRGSDTETPFDQVESVGVGDVITFDLTATFYPLSNSNFPITYTNVRIEDEPVGRGAEDPIPVSVPANLAQLKAPESVTQTVTYTVTDADVARHEIVNTAQLCYQYKSLHSTGAFTSSSTAQAGVAVHASVQYQYVSGTPDRPLPQALADLAPEDLAFHEEGTLVSLLPHVQQTYPDPDAQGVWILQSDWQLNGSPVSDNFTMPASAATLTAVWVFQPVPELTLSKTGTLESYSVDDAAQKAQYTARYDITVENPGGEALKDLTLQDDTLPDPGSVTCLVDGIAQDLSSAQWDTSTHTLILPVSLPRGSVMTLSYSSTCSGTLDESGMLTVEAPVQAQATGAESGTTVQAQASLAQPLICYGSVVIHPADIVIYAGGAPTDDMTVVQQPDGTVAAATNLPEPGFFIHLPPALSQDLRDHLGLSPADVEQLDLSSYLTIEDTLGQVWGLEPYSTQGDSMAFGRRLYRLVPITPGQAPLRMQFYDGERYIVSSDFDIHTALHMEYEMTIYPGRVEAGSAEAVLRIKGEKIGQYSLGLTPGKLIVRGTTTQQVTTPLLTQIPTAPVSDVTARTVPGTCYYINESTLPVEASQTVELLVDEIVDQPHSETLKGLASTVLDTLETTGRLQYQFQYLDLVDTRMGNTWVTASQALDVYWPYPQDTDPEGSFTIIHYEGLDREYDADKLAGMTLGTDYTLDVYTTLPQSQWPQLPFVTFHPLEATPAGLSFQAQDFSPYVLVWDQPGTDPDQPGTDPDQPGTDPDQPDTDPDQPGTDPDQPEPPASSSGGTESPAVMPSATPEGLNTQEHIAYLIGRGGGGIQPLSPITRGEVATVLFRLLTDEARSAYWNTGTPYSDVTASTWCRGAVATLTAMGIWEGYADGTFHPERPITRAEFISVAVRFFDTPDCTGTPDFSDVDASDWFAAAVWDGMALGLIQGREDGTFAPYDLLTRAETAVILNRALGRRPQGGTLADNPWNDNPPQAWYYEDILEASISHTYLWTDGAGSPERWTGTLETPDWTALERHGSVPGQSRRRSRA